MIKGIIFDYDGTLIDTNDLIVYSLKTAAKNVVNKELSDELLDNILGRTLDEQMKMIDAQHYEALMETYKKIYRKNSEDMTYLYDNMDRLVKQLKEQGYQLFILSNKGKRGINFGLNKFNLNNIFDYIISMDDVDKGKPNLEGISKIIEFSKLKPNELILVGDSPYDIEVANTAKITSVLVDWTILNKSNFNSTYEYLMKDPFELLDILEQL